MAAHKFVLSALFAVCSIVALGAESQAQVTYYSDRVEANSTDYLNQRFNNSGWVTVQIQGDGDTDLDLYVFDSYGNQLDSDTGYTDRGSVRYYAQAGTNYSLQVRNLGNVWNAYRLTTHEGGASSSSSSSTSTYYWNDRVEAYSTDHLHRTAETTGWVTIYLRGDGDTDLDLFVYDQYGNQLASDTGYTDSGSVRVYVERGRQYCLSVQNLGNVWNAYRLQIDY